MANLFEKLIDGRKYFEALKQKENIICWGAGSKGRQSLEILKEKGVKVVAFCDSNPNLSGKYVDDIPIYEYATIKELYQQYSICITCVLSNALEIYRMLQEAGEKNEIYFFSNPFKAENKIMDMAEIEKDSEAYEESYAALADDLSRKVFVDFLNWKITGDISIPYRNNVLGWLEFFDTDIIPEKEEYAYIDVGAYTGDSICRFLALVKGKYDRIVAFEPDEDNFEVLKSFVKSARLERGGVELICGGLWSREEKKRFFKRSENEVYESSNFFRDAKNTLSNDLMTAEKTCEWQEVKVRTLDSYLPMFQDNDAILLKIDALASEGWIIQGAEEFIKAKKPVIVMEYGTHSEQIGNIIPFLRSLRADYMFYLRQHESMDNSRTVIYAV